MKSSALNHNYLGAKKRYPDKLLGTRVSLDDVLGPNGQTQSKGLNLENVQPMFNGSVNSHLKYTFSMDYYGGSTAGAPNSLQLMDGIIRYEFSDYFNIWAGRFLPPSDRANLYGPFYDNAWNYPGVVSNYPAIFEGRDNGAAVWGQAGGGMLKWQVGGFDGRHDAYNPTDTPLAAGRLTLELLDPEPGYYLSDTYFGQKHVLALGLAGMSQKNGSGSVGPNGAVNSQGDFTGWSADLLAEYPLADGMGTPTLEGAYYHYSSQGGYGLPDGQAGLVTLSYLMPGGFLKPLVRWQSFSAGAQVQAEGDLAAEQSNSVLDAELDYIVHGNNERYALIYSNLRNSAGETVGNAFKIGSQLIF